MRIFWLLKNFHQPFFYRSRRPWKSDVYLLSTQLLMTLSDIVRCGKDRLGRKFVSDLSWSIWKFVEKSRIERLWESGVMIVLIVQWERSAELRMGLAAVTDMRRRELAEMNTEGLYECWSWRRTSTMLMAEVATTVQTTRDDLFGSKISGCSRCARLSQEHGTRKILPWMRNIIDQIK